MFNKHFGWDFSTKWLNIWIGSLSLLQCILRWHTLWRMQCFSGRCLWHFCLKKLQLQVLEQSRWKSGPVYDHDVFGILYGYCNTVWSQMVVKAWLHRQLIFVGEREREMMIPSVLTSCCEWDGRGRLGSFSKSFLLVLWWNPITHQQLYQAIPHEQTLTGQPSVKAMFPENSQA